LLPTFQDSLFSALDMPKWFLKSIEITGGFLHDAWLRLGGSEIPSCGCES